MKHLHIYDINTIMHRDNETYVCGQFNSTDGEINEEIMVTFNTFELLDWLDTHEMKESIVKYLNDKHELDRNGSLASKSA